MPIEIVARFYFEDQELNETADMLQGTERIFKNHKGTNIKLKIQGSEARIIASFNYDPSRLHHPFESAITKPYPLGCGAGEVWKAEPHDFKFFK